MKRLVIFRMALAAIVATMIVPATASASSEANPHITVATEWDVLHSDGFKWFEATVSVDPPMALTGKFLYSGIWYSADIPETALAYVVQPFRTSGGLQLQTFELRKSPSSPPFMTMSWNPACGHQAVRWEYISFFTQPLMLAYSNLSGNSSLKETQQLKPLNGSMSVAAPTKNKCLTSTWSGNQMPTYLVQ